MRNFSTRLTDLVAAWTDADHADRGRLVTSILSEVLVKDRRIADIRPRPGRAPYFEELLKAIGSEERETGLEPAGEPALNRHLFGIQLFAIWGPRILASA